MRALEPLINGGGWRPEPVKVEAIKIRPKPKFAHNYHGYLVLMSISKFNV